MGDSGAMGKADWASGMDLHPNSRGGGQEGGTGANSLLQELVASASTIASRAGTSVISPAHIKQSIAAAPEKFHQDLFQSTLTTADAAAPAGPCFALAMDALVLLQSLASKLRQTTGPASATAAETPLDETRRGTKRPLENSSSDAEPPPTAVGGGGGSREADMLPQGLDVAAVPPATAPPGEQPEEGEPVKLDYFVADAVDDETVELTLLVPETVTHEVIGKRGAVISQIEVATGTRLTMQARETLVPGQHDFKLVLSGSLKNVSLAQYLVGLKINEHAMPPRPPRSAKSMEFGPGMAWLKILVAEEAVGSIIGKGGAQITSVERESGAQKIQVEKQIDALPGIGGRSVTIYGTARSCNIAQYQISRTVVKSAETDGGGGGGGGGGGAGGGAEPECSMVVPNQMVARLIGKGGSKIAELRASFNGKVDIQIAKPVPGATGRNVRVQGRDVATILQCRNMIEAWLREWSATPAINWGHGKNNEPPVAIPSPAYTAVPPPPPRLGTPGAYGHLHPSKTVLPGVAAATTAAAAAAAPAAHYGAAPAAPAAHYGQYGGQYSAAAAAALPYSAPAATAPGHYAAPQSSATRYAQYGAAVSAGAAPPGAVQAPPEVAYAQQTAAGQIRYNYPGVYPPGTQ
eukprot:SAG22_NODE_1990_length_3201_cov_1.727273_1_plen_635_part_00